ncbi:glycosyltransferase, partial [bacterium]|nr:glycosyltransferase [bacterium]
MKSKLTVLFIGSAGNSIPLNATQRKKFQRLSNIGKIHVLAMIGDGRHLHRWRECGCQFVGVPLSLPRWRRNLWFLWSSAVETIRLARSTPNLVVVTQSPQHAVIPLLLRYIGYRYKVIVETHGDWLDGYFLYHSFRFKRFAYRTLKWIGIYTFRHADAIRTISDATRRLLPAEGKPIYQFPTFTDLDLFTEAAKKRGQLLESQGTSQDILFVGSLIRLKGVDDLLTAFEKIADKHPITRLIFVGEGAKREELQERAKAVALADRVFFTGQLPQHELAERMASAYCLVL